MSYDKNSNIVEANGNIKFFDKVNNYEIYSDKATYLKNEEKIFTEGNSKAINEDGVIITADRLCMIKLTILAKQTEMQNY